MIAPSLPRSLAMLIPYAVLSAEGPDVFPTYLRAIVGQQPTSSWPR
jgi:hypothetical protein